MNPFARRKREVEFTKDLQRVLALPRRDPSSADFSREMTEICRTAEGTQMLRPLQALALAEIASNRGGFCPMRVGSGKTLTSLLAPLVLQLKRPLLILPAALIEKTEREIREIYRQHWRIVMPRILSYEMLGREQSKDVIAFYRPDGLILDEAHRAKNTRAGCTRRILRYCRENPSTAVVALSGTMIAKSLKDFCHLLEMTHGEGAPIPLEGWEQEIWASALDEKVEAFNRTPPGALLKFAEDDDYSDDELATARKGFYRRLSETPAVLCSPGEGVASSLYIEGQEYTPNRTTDENFRLLRNRWETPDGFALSQAVDVWRHSRELALGFHYVQVDAAIYDQWRLTEKHGDPKTYRERLHKFLPEARLPEWYLEPRRLWAKFVRKVLTHSRTLDTELQVAKACMAGELEDDLLTNWQNVKDNIKVKTIGVWHDDSALLACEEWAEKNTGIIWCEHTFFADELSRRTGLPYYGAQGTNDNGDPIEKADPSKSLIASVAANGTGRNLQAWSNNLITSCLTGAHTWEQLLGRTHRDGQTADEVRVTILLSCFEHLAAWDKARGEARMSEDMMGSLQKILLADVTWPRILLTGPRWSKQATEDLDSKIATLLAG